MKAPTACSRKLVLLRASPCTTETAMGTPSCIDRDRDIEKSVNVYIFER
ncbi:MAG: hypothetical protein QOI59_3331, partial [Gammaproteobacteria bacterium]|nr:hypothetical protein [Gammaproteobacteria bacterium]